MSNVPDQIAGPICTIQGCYGLMAYNQHDQFIGASLAHYGEYGEEEVALLRQLIQPHDVVWEVGANNGSQSVALSKMLSTGTLVCFEPQIEVFKILTANLALNHCERAISQNMALGDTDGHISLPAVDYTQYDNFGGISLLLPQVKSDHQVQLFKMDSLAWLPAPNLLKIDVEGMETHVLRGGAATIAQHRPIIYLENDRVENSEALIQLIWDMGYRLYWHTPALFNPNNYFNNTVNLFGNFASFNMLCLPNESPLTVDVAEITDKYAHPLKPIR